MRSFQKSEIATKILNKNSANIFNYKARHTCDKFLYVSLPVKWTGTISPCTYFKKFQGVDKI